MKLDKEASRKAGYKVFRNPNKSQPKVVKAEKIDKKPKKVEILESEEEDESNSFGFRDEE